MSDEVRTYAATIAHGATQGAPTTVQLAMPVRVLRRVELLVPPGANGVMGIALAAAGQIVVPYGLNQWIVASGETVAFDLDGQIESGSWQLWGYNSGTFAHTVQVRLFLDLPVGRGGGFGPGFAPVPLSGVVTL